MNQISGLPELSEKESRVLEVVREFWPASALDVAQHFNENISTLSHKKRHSTNYAYYLKKLVQKRLLLSKRVGNALIVWPVEAEAFRAVHKMIKGEYGK